MTCDYFSLISLIIITLAVLARAGRVNKIFKIMTPIYVLKIALISVKTRYHQIFHAKLTMSANLAQVVVFFQLFSDSNSSLNLYLYAQNYVL